jgi:hypothetical protein
VYELAEYGLLKVCFAPDSDRTADIPAGPICAISRHCLDCAFIVAGKAADADMKMKRAGKPF